MRCTILSTRWKNIWASVSNLDFENKDKSDTVGCMSFVGRVLYFPGSTDIQKICLHCSYVRDYTRIDGWIRTAITRNANELDVIYLRLDVTFN
ncbi:hypothetical protein DVH24_026931 [Malus domestica]|uniref:Uncharacterized protein n=1 Tax=Malus domestica TaxID=3750 RepID=A0A498IPZ6_MALDO|nr:hypothetical protein DVH24_026931 [Malus domestica]